MKTFPGDEVRLTDQHGVPLEFIVSELFNSDYTITWVDYIEAARKPGWWDFQTFEKLTMLSQELSEYRTEMKEILTRFKLYVLNFPLKTST